MLMMKSNRETYLSQIMVDNSSNNPHRYSRHGSHSKTLSNQIMMRWSAKSCKNRIKIINSNLLMNKMMMIMMVVCCFLLSIQIRHLLTRLSRNRFHMMSILTISHQTCSAVVSSTHHLASVISKPLKKSEIIVITCLRSTKRIQKNQIFSLFKIIRTSL